MVYFVQHVVAYGKINTLRLRIAVDISKEVIKWDFSKSSSVITRHEKSRG